MHFQLNREIKMHQKIDDDDDDEIFKPEQNVPDVFSNFTYELSFPLYSVSDKTYDSSHKCLKHAFYKYFLITFFQ